MIMSNCSDKAIPVKMRGQLKNMEYPAFVDIKYDGELAKVGFENGAWYTVNKYGNARLNWQGKSWPKLPCNAIFYGELFYGEGKAGDLYKLLSNKQNDAVLNIKLFDILSLDGNDLTQLHMLERKEIMVSVFEGKMDMIGEFFVAENEHQVTELMYEVVDRGYEGIVVKNMSQVLMLPSMPWVKLKNKDRTNYLIVDIDNVKERMEIEYEVVAQDGTKGLRRCGVKLTIARKNEVNVGDWALIEHQGVLDTGGLRHPVFIEKGEEE